MGGRPSEDARFSLLDELEDELREVDALGDDDSPSGEVILEGAPSGDHFEPEIEDATVIQGAFGDGSFFGDRFRIERLIARGGMGSVFEATDFFEDEACVALKVLEPSRKPGSEERERFRREAEILSALQHPNIVRIHAFGHSLQGTPWLALEMLEGETLRERVQRKGPMEPYELVPILDQACSALEAAHARGVIHRDLKPDNLYLPASGAPRVKLLDFGLSLVVGVAKLTQTGTVLGTPRYMSPEQIASAHKADGQTDVYALGVIVYEALAGQSPFQASDHGQLLGAILQGRQEPLINVRPDLAPEIGAVLQRATARSVEDRYRTPLDFARAFAEVAGVRPSSPDEPRFSAVPTPPPARITGDVPVPSGAPRGLPAWAAVLLIAGGLAVVAAGAVIAYVLLSG